MCDNKKFPWYPEDKFNNQLLFRKWVGTSSSKTRLEQWPHSRQLGKLSLSWSKWYKLQFFLWTACKTVWVEVLWNKCKNTKECPRGELKQLILFLPYHQSVMFYFTARLHFFFFYWRVMSSLLVKFALSAHFQSILYSNQWQIYLKLIIFSDNFTIVQACRWWQCILHILCV